MVDDPDLKFDVFISYSSSDRDQARRLAGECRRQGLRTWFDEWELKSEDSWAEAIQRGLESSRSCAVLLSESSSSDSPWLSREWTKIQERAWQQPAFTVVPVTATPSTEVPVFLRQWHVVDGTTSDAWPSVTKYIKRCINTGSTGRSEERASEELERLQKRFSEIHRAILIKGETHPDDRTDGE